MSPKTLLIAAGAAVALTVTGVVAATGAGTTVTRADAQTAAAVIDAYLAQPDPTVTETITQTVTATATATVTAAPTASSTPTPSATPSPTATARTLRYAPPVLVSPITVNLTATARKAFIPANQDAIVRCPERLANVPGGIEINGGRNVVLVACEINYTTVDVSRALFIKGNSATIGRRTVFIEGLKVSGGTINGDAIDVDMQGVATTLILQNVDIGLTLAGSYATNHSDALQTWNGPNALLVDGLIVRNAQYQAMFLDPVKFQPGLFVDDPGVQLHNVHVIQPANPGYAFYNASAGRTAGSNVRVHVGTVTNRVSYPAGAWPFVTSYSGPLAPDSDFLSGLPGIGYVSPGYGP